MEEFDTRVQEEFKQLASKQAAPTDYPTIYSMPGYKNRYCDVLPYENTRVKLQSLDDVSKFM
jgi:protein tyrosine phosphatase